MRTNAIGIGIFGLVLTFAAWHVARRASADAGGDCCPGSTCLAPEGPRGTPSVQARIGAWSIDACGQWS